MMDSDGLVPGAVVAAAGSCLTTNVYVVFSAIAASSHVCCTESHAFAAITTNLDVHEPSDAFTCTT